jgi:hypothetical protein
VNLCPRSSECLSNGTAHPLGITELIGVVPKGLDKWALI